MYRITFIQKPIILLQNNFRTPTPKRQQYRTQTSTGTYLFMPVVVYSHCLTWTEIGAGTQRNSVEMTPFLRSILLKQLHRHFYPERFT